MSRKAIPKKTRLELYEKYNHRCGYCGCEIAYKDMQVDHLKPVYVHGEYLGDMDSEQLNDISNFIPACRQCNLYKSTFELEEFPILRCIYTFIIHWMRKATIMTENEALEYLKKANRQNDMLGILPGSDIGETLIKALEEVQQYRNTTLSPEQVRTLQKRFLDVSLRSGEYMAIGTPEECRAAMEKQRRKIVKNPYGTSYIWKAGYCPVCGCGVTARWNYCQCCGQKLNWENA